MQIGLRANQNVPIVPQIPGTNQKQPVKPYRFVTFSHDTVVLRTARKAHCFSGTLPRNDVLRNDVPAARCLPAHGKMRPLRKQEKGLPVMHRICYNKRKGGVTTMTARREQILRNAVASARMEGLLISVQTEKDCRRYLEGKIDTDTLVQEALKRYRNQDPAAQR